MSVKIMTSVWQYSSLRGTELLTLVALADCANDEGECWPSLSTLAKKVRLSVRQVCKIVGDIERRTGELRRERSNGGRNRRTRYRVTTSENTVRENSVTGNTVTENTVLQAIPHDDVVARLAELKAGLPETYRFETENIQLPNVNELRGAS